ncbi:MAG: hypothetical protein KAI47_26435, partial [Deltaproteobacteria bacterium]|nr:hypothetical protein [Deltaproteobacteria bacterium]
ATLIARALRVQSFSAIDFPRLDGAQSSALGSLNPDVPLAKALALLLLWPRWSLRSLTPEDLLGNAPTSPPYATNLRITWTDVLHVGKIIGFHFVARHRHLPRMVGIDESDALQHNRALDVILNAAATWEITDPLPFRTFAAIRLLDLLDPEERAGLDRSSLSVHLPAFDTACPDQMDLLASDETSIS